MEEKAIDGVRWTVLSSVTNKGVAVVSTVVLARLLLPEDFGVVMLGMVVIAAVTVFADIAPGMLVLRHDLDEQGKGTVLTVMLGLALVIGVSLVAVSPFIGQVFNEPKLPGVVIALSPMVMLAGLSGFYEAVIWRELEFRRRFASQFMQTVTYATVSVGLAATGVGVWSLVAGQVAAATVYCGAVMVLSPYRVRLAFVWMQVREIFSTTHGFVTQRSFWYLQENADYVSVGKVLGTAPLGFYSMAYRIADLPYWVIADPVGRVIFPGLARMRARNEDPVPSYLGALRFVALIACPVGVLLSAAAGPFTETVFGQRWAAMIGPLSVLGLWAALRPLRLMNVSFLNAAGQAGLVGLLSAITLVPLLLGALLGAAAYGITGVSLAVLAETALALVVLAVLAERKAGASVGDQWCAVQATAISCLPAWAATRIVAEATNAPAAATLALSVVAGLVVYVGAISLLEPGVLPRTAAQVAHVLGRRDLPTAPTALIQRVEIPE